MDKPPGSELIPARSRVSCVPSSEEMSRSVVQAGRDREAVRGARASEDRTRLPGVCCRTLRILRQRRREFHVKHDVHHRTDHRGYECRDGTFEANAGRAGAGCSDTGLQRSDAAIHCRCHT